MLSLDAVTLRRLWPRAPQPLVDAIAVQAPMAFAKFGLTTQLRVAHFMAQVSHESNGGTIETENLNYTSAARIAAVWPTRFTPASAASYVGNPRKRGDAVYDGRMGDRAGSDDGYNYRGRGLLQITGCDNYRTIGAIVGLPLVDRPDLVTTPSVVLEVAAAEFQKLGCLPFCDADNVMAVTRRVNGGYTGLASRKAWLNAWKAALARPMPFGLVSQAHADDLPPDELEAELADAPPPVEIPRGSDEVLPAGLDHPGRTMSGDKSSWAAVIGIVTTIGATLGQAVDTLRPLLEDPRTLGAAAAIAAIAGAVILYENRARLRSDHA